MQLSEMRLLVKQAAGLDPNDAMVPDDVLDGFINRAVRDISMIQDWDWDYKSETINTVKGQVLYDVATDWRKTALVNNDTTGYPLKQVSLTAAFRNTRLATEYDGLPASWHIQGGKLRISPAPDDVYALTHVYVASAPKLVNDTDEPVIPEWASDLIVIKAAMMVVARTDNSSQAQLLAQQEREIGAAMEDEARRARAGVQGTARRDWRV